MSGDSVVLTEQDGGRKVPVPADHVIELRLPENPTTGVRWSLPDGVEVIEDSYEDTSDAPGAAAMRVLRLKVKKPGRLHMERRQAWEQGSAPDATFEVELEER